MNIRGAFFSIEVLPMRKEITSFLFIPIHIQPTIPSKSLFNDQLTVYYLTLQDSYG